MSNYILKTALTVEATSQTNLIETVIRDNIAGLAIDIASSVMVQIQPLSEVSIDLPGITMLSAIVIQSATHIDVSIQDDVALDPIYTGIGSNTYFRTFNPPVAPGLIRIKNMDSSETTITRVGLFGMT